MRGLGRPARGCRCGSAVLVARSLPSRVVVAFVCASRTWESLRCEAANEVQQRMAAPVLGKVFPTVLWLGRGTGDMIFDQITK